jgi:hypothetical protein
MAPVQLLQGMAFFSSWWGYGLCPGFVGKWEEREGRIAGKVSKIIFSPVSAFAGEKKLHSAVQKRHRAVFFFFFFLEKEKRFGGDPKMGYDIQVR